MNNSKVALAWLDDVELKSVSEIHNAIADFDSDNGYRIDLIVLSKANMLKLNEMGAPPMMSSKEIKEIDGVPIIIQG